MTGPPHRSTLFPTRRSSDLRALDLGIEVPGSPLEAVMSAEVWSEVYDRLAELIREHRTTLVFVNTRRLAERADRKSTRLNSSHPSISYAVFCLKKKTAPDMR